MTSVTMWDGEASGYSIRVRVKEQDSKFQRVMRKVHPELVRRSLPAMQKPHETIAAPAQAPVITPPKKGIRKILSDHEMAELDAIMRRPSVSKAVSDVALKTGLTPSMIVSRSREKDVILARGEVLYKLNRGGFSLTQLGRIFHRDHTTVLAAVRKHKERVAASTKVDDA